MQLEDVSEGLSKWSSKASVAPYLDSLAPYASKAISDTAKRDPGFVNLSIGEPWFGPPPLFWREFRDIAMDAQAASGIRAYVHSRGGSALRSAIVERLGKQGIQIGSEQNVLVTHGASEAFTLAVLAGTQPNDEVIVPDPSYMIYEPVCRILGRNCLRPPMAADLSLDVERIERAVTPRTRMIVVNSPCNPSGWVATRDELTALLELSVKRGIWLIHDEVYDDFVYDESTHVSLLTLDGSLSHSLQINSLSKRYGVPGLRIGWIAGNEAFVRSALRAHEHMTLSVGYFADAIAARLMSDETTAAWVTDRCRELQARRDSVVHLFSNLGGARPVSSPAGGFFVFADVSPTAQRIGQADGEDDAGVMIARYLAEQFKVAVVPGSVYGRRGRDFVRLVFAVEEPVLDCGLERLSAALS